MGRLEQLTTRAGFVRPRYDDGTFDDALPLRERFEELFLAAEAPIAQLALIGARGSGLTTTLAWLHALTEKSERSALTLKDVRSAPRRSLEQLASGEGVLFLDTSVTPIAPRTWRGIRRLFSRGLPGLPGSREVLRRARLVVSRPSERADRRPQQGDWPSGLSNPQRAYLAPWSDDDLLELLGSREDYRERRAELFAALRALPRAETLLARPRTSRWLIEAALRLEPGQLTLARLYGQILARLTPGTRRLLREVDREGLGPAALQRLLCDPPRHAEEVCTLFELPRALANVLLDPAHDLVERAVQLGFLRPELLAQAREEQERAPKKSLVSLLIELGALSPGKLLALSGQVQPDLGEGTRVTASAALTLPGLQHCLAAQDCVDAVRENRCPREIDPEHFPYLRGEIDVGVQRRLRGWLSDPSPPRGDAQSLPRDAAAATLLWVSGETPDLYREERPLLLRGAHLAGVSQPGAVLTACDLSRVDLGQARLEGASLREARLVATRALNAAFDGADFAEATLLGARLDRASLRGARLERLRATRCELRQASLQGAVATGAWFDACAFDAADLTRADLSHASLVECGLEGASLASARLCGAKLLRMDLREADGVALADLRGAVLTRCALSGLDLRELAGAGLRLQRCELAGADLSGADLREARLDECWLPGAQLVGADLRGAQLLRVDFGGAEGEGPRADLRGADLRGATLRGVDLREVDLRGALLDERLRINAARMGARL